MKGLALALWLLVFTLLVGILRTTAVGESASNTAELPERSLLIIVSKVQSSTSDVTNTVAIMPDVKTATYVVGCSRLGVFPRRDWAERVAIVLSDAMPAAADSSVSQPNNEQAMKSWRVQHIGQDAYYLQFNSWSIEDLAARMTLQRDVLKRLLSVRAIPEAC